jgi:hypothetical protein
MRCYSCKNIMFVDFFSRMLTELVCAGGTFAVVFR